MRTYSELARLKTFEERYEYLRLRGVVGEQTFGHERWLNQRFYMSRAWKKAQNDTVARDLGLDLGVDGYPIVGKLFVHHMNPLSPEALRTEVELALDPEYLITCSFKTHNAIHYNNSKNLPRMPMERKPGDTTLW